MLIKGLFKFQCNNVKRWNLNSSREMEWYSQNQVKRCGCDWLAAELVKTCQHFAHFKKFPLDTNFTITKKVPKISVAKALAPPLQAMEFWYFLNLATSSWLLHIFEKKITVHKNRLFYQTFDSHQTKISRKF